MTLSPSAVYLRLAMELSLPVFRLSSVAAGIRTPNIRLRANALTRRGSMVRLMSRVTLFKHESTV